jgi:hypothetical protein
MPSMAEEKSKVILSKTSGSLFPSKAASNISFCLHFSAFYNQIAWLLIELTEFYRIWIGKFLIGHVFCKEWHHCLVKQAES